MKLTPPDFVPMLKTQLFPFNAHLAGHPDYLDAKDKNAFRQSLINELLPRNGNLKRYEAWYLGYYMQPYMNSASRDEFIRRWADVQDNMMLITEDNKISVVDVRKNELWMVRFSELLAESQFRGGIPSNKVALETIMRNVSLNRFTHPSKSTRELPYIFKFGKLEHLQQMKSDGSIRLANSKSYLSSSMNLGQKDDENNFTFTIFPELLSNLDRQTGLAGIDPIDQNDLIRVTHQQRQNYMMWCASHRYDFRVPHAFNAEAVAIITQPRKFKKDVSRALKAIGMAPTIGKVRFFDPYLDLETKLDVRFSKHFRFSYQNEYRIVAQGQSLPEHMFLKIEELPQYCEIIKLT